ncbi:hypothetical protein [uncultured Duncaniella sp.]|uniref:hypothetical protein n=1 Tax=uncultured Duncaniella sp. TaxID=2768039 RepID=UPI0025B67A0F|nr:hypothetical protein [uncultured Duncaniella sp.]
MARGKQTCKILKEIRRQIAEANDIEFVTSECRYKGDCLGTCPKCEAEVRYLEQQLRSRQRMGKAVAIAGISAASIALLTPPDVYAQSSSEVQVISTDSIVKSERINPVKLKGIAKYKHADNDGNVITEELIGATVLNLTNGKGIATDIDGKFEIDASQGDSIEISHVGLRPQIVTVTDLSRPVIVTLDDSHSIVLGFVSVVKREENHYLDLNVFDEYGNLMDRDKLDVVRIWIDEDGEEDYEYLSPEYFDDKHPCRIYWDYDYGLEDENGKPLKEATLRIEAEGYDDPVIIKVKYPKRNTKKTIKFEHKKK